MHCSENTQMLCETHKCLHVRAQTRPHTLPLKGSLPLQPVLHSLSKLLQHAGQMNVSHFLFTSDLPLSPCKPEEGDWKRRGEPDRGSGERKKRGERKNRGPASSSSFSLHISSLSLSLLFSFCLSKGELGGQSLATSNLQPVHLACYWRAPFIFFFSFFSFFALGAFEPRSAKVSLSSVAAALNERTGKFSKDLGKKKHHLTQKDAKKWNEIAKTQVSPAFFLSIRRTSKETKGCILRRFRGTCWVGRISADHKYYLIRSVPGRLTALALAAVFNHNYLKL